MNEINSNIISKVGNVNMSIEFFNDTHTDVLRCLFSNFFVLEARINFNVINYQGVCPLFRSLNQGDFIPTYEVIFNITNGLCESVEFKEIIE